MAKRLGLIFIVSFILNAIWENLHVFLYANYMGGPITEFILLRAALSDALYIILMTLPFVLYPKIKHQTALIIIFGLILSICIEYFGLSTGRWEYNSMMPIIPLLRIGFTPTIQLAFSGLISFKLEKYLHRRK